MLLRVPSASKSVAWIGGLRATQAAFSDSHTGSGILVQQLPITGKTQTQFPHTLPQQVVPVGQGTQELTV